MIQRISKELGDMNISQISNKRGGKMKNLKIAVILISLLFLSSMIVFAEYQNYGSTDYRKVSIEDAAKERKENRTFVIRKEDISSKYLPGKSLASKQTADRLVELIEMSIPLPYKCSKFKIIQSDIRENLYFKGTSINNSSGEWTEYWLFNACGKKVEIPVMFNYNKGQINTGFAHGNYKILD